MVEGGGRLFAAPTDSHNEGMAAPRKDIGWPTLKRSEQGKLSVRDRRNDRPGRKNLRETPKTELPFVQDK